MDGLFHGKPYEQMDDLGVPLFLETPMYLQDLHSLKLTASSPLKMGPACQSVSSFHLGV